jgi:hypothetical protein
MSTRSSLTVVSGTTITSAWGNGIRDHVVPKTTSDDVSSEGQLAANTSTDRIMVHNGTSAARLMHYTSSGRTGCVGTASAVPIGSGVSAKISFTMSTDADGFYTGWDGSVHAFTVPTGLGGVYAITVNAYSSVTATSGGIAIAVATGGLTYLSTATPNTNWASVALAAVPIAAAAKFSVSLENRHSASSNFDVRIWAYRLFA